MFYNDAQVCLTGYVANQPEFRTVSNGIPLLTMRVAWTNRHRDAVTGEWVDGNTSFVRVNCWRKLAENLSTCLRKGDPVLIRGRLDIRPFTGKDERVVEFINRGGALDEFYEHLDPLLDYLLPQYLAEGKSHLVIAVGCTGGRHRSVAITEHLAERYRTNGSYLVDVAHRDEGEGG